MIANAPPKVLVGMPVYNEERFIQQTLESLLAQDYTNYEILVADNCSTDSTWDICCQIAQKTNKILLHKHSNNIGSIQNFDFVKNYGESKYFMWAGAHDLWHPSYMRKCVEKLESDNSLVIVNSLASYIDQKGNVLVEVMPEKIDTQGKNIVRSYLGVIWNVQECNLLHGVVRRNCLEKTQPFLPMLSSDHIFLAELALQGTIAQLPEVLFFRRRNRDPERFEDSVKRTFRMYDGEKDQDDSKFVDHKVYLQRRSLLHEHLKIIRNVDMNTFDYFLAYLATHYCFSVRFGVRIFDIPKINGVIHRLVRALGLEAKLM